jgi:hypothetical protein
MTTNTASGSNTAVFHEFEAHLLGDENRPYILTAC